MKALELSGVHVKSMLHATFTNYNKDGTARKNARAHEWWVLPTTIMHKENGDVKITGVWFTRHPPQRNRLGKKSWATYYSVATHPDALPHYADVEVVPL